MFFLLAFGIIGGCVLILIEIVYERRHLRKKRQVQLARQYGQLWKAKTSAHSQPTKLKFPENDLQVVKMPPKHFKEIASAASDTLLTDNKEDDYGFGSFTQGLPRTKAARSLQALPKSSANKENSNIYHPKPRKKLATFV